MSQMIYVKEIEEYIQFVKNNPNEVNKDIKLLIKNIVIPTLERNDVFFDREQFERCVNYCERWYYKLIDYQKFMYALVFMYDNENRDIVIFPDILMLIARGNGKDGCIMPLANYLQTKYYGVKNYHIDIVATSEEQALNSFNVVYNMLEANKNIMRKHFYWNKTEIINIHTKSILRFNTSNAKTKDGKQIGLAIFNELHAYEDYKQINVYSSGLGKIKHARTITITTNGNVRDGPLDEKINIAISILNGEPNYLGMLPILYRLDKPEEVHEPMKKFLKTGDKKDIDIRKWCKSNPSIRYMPILCNIIIQDYIKMTTQISYKQEFMTKRMNLPTIDHEDAVTSWDNILKSSFIDIEKRIERERPDILGRKCVVGFDFASLNDFASVIFLFKVNNEYITFKRTWICKNSPFFSQIKFPFDMIGEEGYEDFEIVDTDTIDEGIIVNWIMSNASKFNIVKIIMDNYRFKLVKKAFEEYNVSMEDKNNPDGLIRMIRNLPSIIAMTAPKIEIEYIKGNINHGNSAMMRWSINNTGVKKQKDSNMMYFKIEPKLRKNDSFMAFVCAMSGQELLDEKVIYAYA